MNTEREAFLELCRTPEYAEAGNKRGWEGVSWFVYQAANKQNAALQKRIEELEAVLANAKNEALEQAASIKVDYVVDKTNDAVRNKINGYINEAVQTAINQYKQSIRALKAGDVQAPKEVVYKLTDAQIEAIALLDKYWVGGFRNEKFDWMNFAKDVLKQAAQTDTEGK